MPNPNNFECKACGATFDNKDQLDNHHRRAHPSGAVSGTKSDQWGGSGKEAGTGVGTGRGTSNPTEKKNR